MNPTRRFGRHLCLLLVAAFALAGAEGAIHAAAPGLTLGFAATPALADDDDDDGDDDDDDRPRRGMRVTDDDDDDDRPARRRAPRRPAPRPEIVASNVTDAELAQIRAAGFGVLAERRLTLLPAATVRLSAPRNVSAATARARLAAIAPAATVDLNTLYRPNVGAACPPEACFSYAAPADWAPAACPARGTVGLIDTRVDPEHPALEGRTVETATTRGEKRAASSPAHGTDVAILLAAGAAPGGDLKLVAVDAFHRAGGSDRADAFDLVAAIDLLAARGVGVVNLSLAGPPNALLDRAGSLAAARGMILVAAVGNEGPKARPSYPAAYSWAVGVTAVDPRGRVYPRAGRGAHVAFAAPGVRLQLPDRGLKPGPTRSGTSYAAPMVAAALSSLRAGGETKPADTVVASLAGLVDDLGAPGRDPVFGWGSMKVGAVCAEEAAAR